MLRVRSILLAGLTVVAVSAITSATASAASHVFLIEGTELATEVAVESESQITIIELPILKSSISVICDEGLSFGEFKPKGESALNAEMRGCNVVEDNKGKEVFLPECSVTEPVETWYAGGLLTETGVDESKEFLSRITVNTCALKGAYTLEGPEDCAISEAEFKKKVHNITCTPAGSKLASGKESVSLFNKTQVMLCEVGENWSSK